MRADMAAIRALGTALATHAADLNAVAAALRSMPSPADALGPVAERFVTAFTEAVTEHSAAVAALGIHTDSGALHAEGTVEVFHAAGQRAAKLLPQV
ncbi:hypothetical protein A5740_12630 [Mycobacterium sp. GA-1841]|nr:hypothetical protein A5740_12630 [Mycobacterium sp. GA-1841]